MWLFMHAGIKINSSLKKAPCLLLQQYYHHGTSAWGFGNYLGILHFCAGCAVCSASWQCPGTGLWKWITTRRRHSVAGREITSVWLQRPNTPPWATCRYEAEQHVILWYAIIIYVLIFLSKEDKICLSYTLSREYWVVRNRGSRLLFTNEDRLCTNLRVQEQSTNMTSQCQCLAFAWRHRSTVMTSQC